MFSGALKVAVNPVGVGVRPDTQGRRNILVAEVDSCRLAGQEADKVRRVVGRGGERQRLTTPPTNVTRAIGWLKESVTKFALSPSVVAALLLTEPRALPVTE